MELGIALSSEENSPADLVRHARAAEEAGLGFGLISDADWAELQEKVRCYLPGLEA